MQEYIFTFYWTKKLFLHRAVRKKNDICYSNIVSVKNNIDNVQFHELRELSHRMQYVKTVSIVAYTPV